MDAQGAFQRYEEIRHRLPQTLCQGAVTHVSGIRQIIDTADVFVFDAFGVLNVGSTPIKGARACVDALRAAKKRLFVLTNAASQSRAASLAKFTALGFDFSPDEIISSRDAVLAALPDLPLWGVIADAAHQPGDLGVPHLVLGDRAADYDRVAGFLFLSSAQWSAARQEILEASLASAPRPFLVGNPDLVAPRETGLSREPGLFSHAVQDSTAVVPEFHGKPYPSVYQRVMAALPDGQPRDRILMLGDTLHTDILGACAQGWRSGLVTDHGLFAGRDVATFIERSGIRPDWIMPSI